MNKLIDMTGWIMKEHGVPDSKWTVLQPAGKKWVCQCECGTIKEVDGYNLRKGGTKSCGKCGSKKNRTIDMTGWKMWEHGVPNSLITVIKQVTSKQQHAMWECKCKCGNPNTFIVDGSNLRSGHTLSCGCLRTGINKKDRSQTWVNNIFVGDIVGKNTAGQYLYNCTCYCGNHFIEVINRLTSGHRKSCGCLKSKGEQKIKQLLTELQIPFIQEYELEDTVGPHNGKRRMDFAIYHNNNICCFIEYQGEQHYDKNNAWYHPEADNEKKQYCIKHSIPLIEISYEDFDKIDQTYLLKLIGEYL